MSRVVVLTGGVGGAKLALGLTALLGGERVTAIINTGDDFSHLGLAISPDIDTLLYTLSGKSDVVKGWGLADESWNFMASLRSLGGEDWFQLGDGDLALHVLRTAALARGESLSAITASFARAWGVTATMLPMTDDPVATMIDTDEGLLPFQTYFVARRCEPRVREIRFDGAAAARPAAGVLEAIVDPSVSAIVIAPSNPWLSVDPVLAVPGLREALRAAPAPVIAVSPVRNGQSFKGPTSKIMSELGLSVDSATIAAHYGDLLDGLVVDTDDDLAVAGLAIDRTDIAMPTLDRKRALAAEVLAMATRLRG
ncbi:MAG: 2-phospho-L-lactate transferase [Pseudomonadota bacterium]